MDKDEIKNNLTIDQIFELLTDLGGEPIAHGDYITALTICHGGDHHKLYYYDNTKLFQCYSNCGSFDVFELIVKIKQQEQKEYSLPQAIYYIANYFGIVIDKNFDDGLSRLSDWEFLKRYESINNIPTQQIVKMEIYDNSILKHLPHPRIAPWEREGISNETINKFGICFDPVNNGIVIPHYNENDELIGIRERTLIREEEVNGKYRPAYLGRKMYNHPLGFCLYGLNKTKNAIAAFKKAVIFESEKSVLMLDSYLGDSNISVACCGSNISSYQMRLLLNLGVEEVIIAFDRQFQAIGDIEFQQWTKKLTKIHEKYKNYCQISFMFDKYNLISYKASPIDEGLDKFITMYNERVTL